MGIHTEMLFSLLLFISGIYLYRKKSFFIADLMFFSIMFLCLFLFVVYGLAHYFTGKGFDEAAVFHVQYGIKGAGIADYFVLISVSATLLFSCFILLIVLIRKRSKGNSKLALNFLIPISLLILSIVFNPAASSIVDFPDAQEKNNFDMNDPKTIEFFEYYNQPELKKITSATKNLVVIYAEGLERTYFNESIFPGVIKELRKIESSAISFTNLKQAANTGWTIAGMVASQCGLPLFTTSNGNSMFGMDEFMPAATCLGDLLHNEGYELVYMGGADLDFAGKGKFYETHKFDRIIGKKKLRSKLMDPSYSSHWGVYDDTLFDEGFKEFVEMSKKDKKFGLFLLTLDTHHPKGLIPLKYREKNTGNSNPILNAVSRSDYNISDFINKIKSTPYSQNTVIVLLSDHLAMRNTASRLLKQTERSNLFMVISDEITQPEKIDRVGSAFDIGPTCQSPRHRGLKSNGKKVQDIVDPENNFIE